MPGKPGLLRTWIYLRSGARGAEVRERRGRIEGPTTGSLLRTRRRSCDTMREPIASVVRTAGAWPNVRLVSRRRRESTFHQNRRMHMNLATIGLVIGVGALAGC